MGADRSRGGPQVCAGALSQPHPGDDRVPRVVRVLPDASAIDKLFDYLVPAALDDEVRIGTMVRVPLQGRRVGGWVVADRVEPPPGVKLQPIAKVTGWGPPEELFELAEWAAWRWSGRRASLLRTASPDHAVRHLPSRSSDRPGSVTTARTATSVPTPETVAGEELTDRIRQVFENGGGVLRLPPAVDIYPVVAAAAALGHALVLAPSIVTARHLGLRLRRAGHPVAVMPNEWAAARAGATVVGSRAAAWAPVIDVAAIVVLDEHDESWQQEQAPTWHARDVAIERGRRAGVPVVLVSPMPTLEAEAWRPVLAPSRTAERNGWPIVDVVDRRPEDPTRAGLFSPRLARALQDHAPVVCVLNRKGRSRLLACVSCGELARCEACEAIVVSSADGSFTCRRCGRERPAVCLGCGRTKFKNLRAGVTRVREELEALARSPVVEVTAETAGTVLPTARVYVGTEAALHQVPEAKVVAFLDFDQELLAPRYRAAEEALALLVRAARLVGGRRDGGRILVQTRIPHHEVVQAALHADPIRVSDAERARRELLRFPPVAALAVVSGASAEAFIEGFGQPDGVEVLGPSDGRWLLRADHRADLLDALAVTPRPPGRLRIEVDPLRL